MTSKSILVVDDESYLTYLLSYKLEQTGLNVLTASDGREGLEMAIEHRPELVVADYHMPVMTGLELCIELRANPLTTDIPVIMVTGRGHRLTKEDMAMTNIRHLLAKPFSARELLARIFELTHAEPIAAEHPEARRIKPTGS